MPSSSHTVADQSAVFDLLADPETHGIAGEVSRIDTHGAAVFLAGDDAYKVKRAVRFPFMDFSTLAKRQAACEAEIRVNRPNAPEIYLGVLAITRDNGRLRLGGTGDAVEWCVHMRRFDENLTLDRLAEAGKLSDAVIRHTAAAVVRSHRSAPERAGVGFASAFEAVIAENGDSLSETPDLFPAARVAALTKTSLAAQRRVRPILQAREEQSRVRRCHGDLHLRNIVLLEETPTLFDAIEFDEALATTDVFYDLAFLLMDLGERGMRAEANLVANRYLAEDRDPGQMPGFAAMALFVSVRAAIRAKVAAAALASAAPAERPALEDEARRYFEFAEQVLAPATPRLIAVGGLSGTGKSTLAARLAADLDPFPGALHLRSDVIRKRLMGVAELETLPPSGYTQAVTEQVYATLLAEAEAALRAAQSAIVDAVSQRPEERAAFSDLATRLGVAFTGLWLEAPTATLAARADARTADASDAGGDVVAAQAKRDPGPLDWHRIDAAGDADATLKAARSVVGG